MTVRHIVVFRWHDGTTPAQVQAIDAALNALPGLIPELVSYAHGPDLGLGEGRWDYGIVAECEDEAGWRAYYEHPAHEDVRARVIAPHVQDRAAVQVRS